MSVRLRAENICLGYGEKLVVKNLSLDIPPGEITAIVGPNGCGKSTLIKAMGRLLKPHSGQVYLNDQPIEAMDTRQVATLMSILPQNPIAPEGISVRDLVARGRFPHRSWWQRLSTSDEAAVDAALNITSLSNLGDREISELSGGQRQRAWIAMSLAQQSELLLLDEPTNHLDLVHQVDVLDLVAKLSSRGSTAVVVLHDLTLAARYSSHLVVMKDGRIIAQGAPQEILTEALLLDAFELNARVLHEDTTNTPIVFPLSRSSFS